MISATDKAYAAGLFEGEGCIGISNQRHRSAPIPVCILRCKVAMCDSEPLEFLRSTWGGSVSHPKPRQKEYRPSHVWVISTRQAAAFLVDILPYVRMERMRDKIILGLAFQEQKIRGRHSGHSGEYHRRQISYYERMKAANVRGSRALD